ncbi:hypothetical protein ACFL6S_25345 [Candidatus Poribacteria bacterium]
MVQIDVPIAFAIGSFFADAAHKQLQTEKPEHYYRTMARHNIFQIFFFSWIPVYFLLNYFGWETTHMWWHADSVTAYPYYIPIFMVIFFLVANGGFLLGNWLVRSGRLLANRIVYIVIVIYSGIWIFGQTGSTFRLGTYAEWKAGIAPLFYEDGTFLFMFIFAMVVWIVGLLIFFFIMRREGRRLEAD